jgi:uncharacterized membrane protein (UPF0127 family)
MKIVKADNLFLRFSGFMFKKNPDYALLFENCKSVHTFFMRFDLDLIFIDKNGLTAEIKKNVKPWRVIFPVKNAVSILEIPSYLNNPKNADFLTNSAFDIKL